MDKEVQEVFESIAWTGRFDMINTDVYLKEDENYNIKTGLKDSFLFFTKEGDTKKVSI